MACAPALTDYAFLQLFPYQNYKSTKNQQMKLILSGVYQKITAQQTIVFS